jgi:hypothetical protein
MIYYSDWFLVTDTIIKPVPSQLVILLNLSILLQLVSEFISSCLPSTMQQYQDLKFITALHVSAYSTIIRCSEIQGTCCALCATGISFFIFTMFLNEVNVVPPSMPHVLSFLVHLLPIKCAV